MEKGTDEFCYNIFMIQRVLQSVVEHALLVFHLREMVCRTSSFLFLFNEHK